MTAFPPLAHVALTVRDLSVSTPWYEALFDAAPVIDEDTEPALHHTVYMIGNGTLIGLHQHEHPAPPAPFSDFSEFNVGLDHVAFGCADRGELEKWALRLDELGIDHGDIKDASYGSGVSFRDPDGVALEFFAPPARATSVVSCRARDPVASATPSARYCAGMPRLAYLLYRNEAVSASDFVAHYKAVHSPLAVQGMPRQTYYAANVGVPDRAGEPRLGRPPVAALAFVGFDDLGVLADPTQLYASPELGERLDADGAYLFSRMDGYVIDSAIRWGAERTWPTGQSSPGVQRITLACRRPGIAPAEFRRRCEQLVASDSLGPTLSGALSIVDGLVNDDAPTLDAIIELRYSTIDECTENGLTFDAALAEFVDPATTRTLIADETIWID